MKKESDPLYDVEVFKHLENYGNLSDDVTVDTIKPSNFLPTSNKKKESDL